MDRQKGVRIQQKTSKKYFARAIPTLNPCMVDPSNHNQPWSACDFERLVSFALNIDRCSKSIMLQTQQAADKVTDFLIENGAAVGPIAVATPAAAPTYAVAAAKPAAVAVASAPAPATAAVRPRGPGEGSAKRARTQPAPLPSWKSGWPPNVIMPTAEEKDAWSGKCWLCMKLGHVTTAESHRGNACPHRVNT